MAALRVGRLDLDRQCAAIVESVTLVRGVHTWGTPKGHNRREVPIPRFLITELRAHVNGKGPHELVFTGVKGRPLRSKAFQDAAFTAAAARIGIPRLTPHKLAAHGREPRYRIRRERQACRADARPQVRDDDFGPHGN